MATWGSYFSFKKQDVLTTATTPVEMESVAPPPPLAITPAKRQEAFAKRLYGLQTTGDDGIPRSTSSAAKAAKMFGFASVTASPVDMSPGAEGKRMFGGAVPTAPAVLRKSDPVASVESVFPARKSSNANAALAQLQALLESEIMAADSEPREKVVILPVTEEPRKMEAKADVKKIPALDTRTMNPAMEVKLLPTRPQFPPRNNSVSTIGTVASIRTSSVQSRQSSMSSIGDEGEEVEKVSTRENFIEYELAVERMRREREDMEAARERMMKEALEFERQEKELAEKEEQMRLFVLEVEKERGLERDAVISRKQREREERDLEEDREYERKKEREHRKREQMDEEYEERTRNRNREREQVDDEYSGRTLENAREERRAEADRIRMGEERQAREDAETAAQEYARELEAERLRLVREEEEYEEQQRAEEQRRGEEELQYGEDVRYEEERKAEEGRRFLEEQRRIAQAKADEARFAEERRLLDEELRKEQEEERRQVEERQERERLEINRRIRAEKEAEKQRYLDEQRMEEEEQQRREEEELEREQRQQRMEEERLRKEEEDQRQQYLRGRREEEDRKRQSEEERRFPEKEMRRQEEDYAAEAAFDKEGEIRKAEEKMRKAFAAMAQERGQPMPTQVQEYGNGVRPAGRRGVINKEAEKIVGRANTIASSSVRPQERELPSIPRVNTVAGRPNGLPTGPRGAGPVRNPSVAPSAGVRPGGYVRLPSGPGIKGGLPSGPRGRKV